MKTKFLSIVLILNILSAKAQENTTSKSLKWPRSYEKDNVTFHIGFGNLQPEAFVLSEYRNYEGLQGDAQGSASGVFYMGIDVHKRDNYMIGLYYSNFSAKSGTWIDPNYLELNYFKLSMHQITAKFNYGWYNNKDFGGMLYSGYSMSYRIIDKQTVYPSALLISDPQSFPYTYSPLSYHVTLLGIKGRFTKDSKLGMTLEVGAGNLGIINYGLNYTL